MRGNPLFNVYGYAVLEEPPNGFHYESLQTLPYDRNTYRIMPMKDVFSVMASRLGMTTGGNARSKRDLFGSLWSDDQREEVETVTDNASSVQLQQADDDSDEGYLDRIGSAIVDVGEDVESCLVTAAPYLPLVTKVALFVVPGLREYQMLVMALNVASITSDAYKRYDDGEGMTTVAASAAWQMFMLVRITRVGSNGDSNRSPTPGYEEFGLSSLYKYKTLRHNSERYSNCKPTTPDEVLKTVSAHYSWTSHSLHTIRPFCNDHIAADITVNRHRQVQRHRFSTFSSLQTYKFADR